MDTEHSRQCAGRKNLLEEKYLGVHAMIIKKCPICGEMNDDDWPLDIDGNIVDGGCQTCWEAESDLEYWNMVNALNNVLRLSEVLAL
jgi:hypothetical protein